MTKQVNPEVAYKKGLYYLKGEGEGKSLEKARECFEEAASQGSEQALFELGEMYWWGKPGKDVKKAIHHYELAADKDDYSDLYTLKWIQHRLDRADDNITSMYVPGGWGEEGQSQEAD